MDTLTVKPSVSGAF